MNLMCRAAGTAVDRRSRRAEAAASRATAAPSASTATGRPVVTTPPALQPPHHPPSNHNNSSSTTHAEDLRHRVRRVQRAASIPTQPRLRHRRRRRAALSCSGRSSSDRRPWTGPAHVYIVERRVFCKNYSRGWVVGVARFDLCRIIVARSVGWGFDFVSIQSIVYENCLRKMQVLLNY